MVNSTPFGAYGITYKNTYDINGNIISDENNSYTYNAYGELVTVLGANSSSYTYDERGNILTKTVNGETVSFTYANSGWKDQLISVNGTELTYDANGNVLTYGDKEFTWNTGRNLAQITDGTNTYSYTYDESGIRTSKTVNGVTTYYNTKDGVILSQTDGTNTMYFQYDTNGVPLGFICNGVQYFYLTNQMGDVISITDAQGNELVQYEYDEWGAVASIYTPHNSEAENALANINPLRYRGYYYDNETSYYYLQSRYYSPEICRFINADEYEFANIQKDDCMGTNLFLYCVNDPINKDDFLGTTYLSTYVNITSVQVRGNYITIKYKVKAKVPGISTISIGYEYPSSTRTNGSKKLITNKIGTHSMELKTVGLRCYYRVYGVFTARNFNEKTIIKTLSNCPTGKQTCYHEVSANEANRERIALTIFNIVCWIDWKRSALNITFKIASACSIISTFANNSPPQPKKGHYYKTVSYYSGKYIYTELYIWNSKKSYNHGDYPIYQSKTKTEIPHF